MKILFFLLFIVLNILMAKYHNYLRLQAIKNNTADAIKHGWWAFGYGAACFIPFLFIHNWFFLLSLISLHASVFPVAFSIYEGVNPFNLSTTTTAIFDRILVKLGFKNTKIINIGTFVISIILLFL